MGLTSRTCDSRGQSAVKGSLGRAGVRYLHACALPEAGSRVDRALPLRSADVPVCPSGAPYLPPGPPWPLPASPMPEALRGSEKARPLRRDQPLVCSSRAGLWCLRGLPGLPGGQTPWAGVGSALTRKRPVLAVCSLKTASNFLPDFGGFQ